MNKSELVAIRDYLESDKNFIFSTWLRGLYHGDSWFSEIPKDIFMKHYHKFIEYLLNHANTTVKVACLKDDPEVILGYAVLNKEDTLLHWVFCKSAWRNIGIAKSLVSQSVNTVTHLTKIGLSIKRKRPNIVFNPFAI